MRLKQLEIYGFKTFADATELVFDEGITAIIGPNGSGKSNCADALLWVLAERRLSLLRASEASDVIFAGSAGRRPLGYAEVTLTVDNEDRSLPLDLPEISVTRRVYRNGDHDWRLNGRACRRRDVVELFLDTGVGKTAFSVISQREIDALLSLNPEDRRRLLDEVAGIERYRTQRDETLRRLADTDQSLLRVADLLAELSLQVGPLEAQRRVAQQFLVLRERFERLKLSLQVKDYTLSQRRLERVEEELAGFADSLTGSATDLAQAEAAEQRLRLDLTARDEELTAVRGARHEAETAVERQEGELRLCDERQANLAQRLAQADLAQERRAAAEAEAEAQAAVAAQERERLALDLARVQAGLDQRREAALAARRDEEHAEVALALARRELHDLDAQLSAWRTRREAARETLERATRRLAELAERGRTAAEAIAAAQTRVTEAQSALAAAQEALASGREAHQAAQERVAQAERARTDAQHRAGELRAQVGERQARLRVLREAADHYDGLFRGVRAVLQARDQGRLRGDYRVVADLLTVAEGCDVAIEAALGPRLQDLVCDDGDAAREAIDLLKAQRAGRATFLPLELLADDTEAVDRGPLRRVTGVVGHALDLVTCDQRHELVRRHLLADVVVVREVEVALAARRAGVTRATLVTLDGDLLRPSGAMTGGSREERGPALLTRKRELDTLEREVRGLSDGLAAAEHQGQHARAETEAARTAAGQAQQALEVARRQMADAERGKVQADAAVHQAEANAGRLDESGGQLEADAAAARTAMATLERDLEEHGARRRALAERQEAADGAWRAAREQRRLADEALAHDRVDAARLESRLQALAEAATAREELRRRAEAEAELVARERAGWEREQAALATARTGLQGELERLLAALRTAVEAVDRCRDQRQELALRLEAVSDAVRRARGAQGAAQEARHRAELRQTQAVAELAYLEQSLAEDHPGLTMARAAALAEPIANRGEAAAELQSLREAIAALGDVNVGAIDEFERVGERIIFYERERGDLERARNDLLLVMAEIDVVSRERLAAAFAAVNREFEVLFKRVFGRDGEAALTWSDPDNFLESGLEVHVRLPGKRTQHLTLLSGGERAMTTVTLLLAMFRVKPTPFCLLDELDAPLDDANLRKYRELLREFSRQSQFIVITHNPETTRAADTLYGITMEEPGVSRAYSHHPPPEEVPATAN